MDVTGLAEAGDHILVRDLPRSDKIAILTPEEETVVTVEHTKAAEAEAEAEEEAAEEVEAEAPPKAEEEAAEEEEE